MKKLLLVIIPLLLTGFVSYAQTGWDIKLTPSKGNTVRSKDFIILEVVLPHPDSLSYHMNINGCGIDKFDSKGNFLPRHQFHIIPEGKEFSVVLRKEEEGEILVEKVVTVKQKRK
ncbi:MAG: hypothetical protein NXI10_07740 [bacterium]|nr:hypothetical protein [bacterium]